ncbi:MAG: AMP-binding protein [Peptococcaceae bacterium]|nr:AMP-binding protein [Peptococcaceae bacterium]
MKDILPASIETFTFHRHSDSVAAVVDHAFASTFQNAVAKAPSIRWFICNRREETDVHDGYDPLDRLLDAREESLDREAKYGEVGEIVTRAGNPDAYMLGYYKEPAKTAEAMRNGWFHTGDRGYVDEDGFFYFVDRIKDCIHRRGENISSFLIEKAVNSHFQVMESAAVGVPSELGEEDVKIFLVPCPGETILPEGIIDWCVQRMAYFMVPRYIEVMGKVPKIETGRVQKFILRSLPNDKAWDREKEGYKVRSR